MREKLQKLMQDQGLTSSKLAEILEIQPSGISHLMAGRNKPGFDLLQRILRRFPQINPDWLLLDSDQMYREQYTLHAAAEAAATDPSDGGKATAPNQSAEAPQDLFSHPTAVDGSRMSGIPGGSVGGPQTTPSNTSPAELNLPSTTQSETQIARIVIFYNDHTFESFDAHKKR